MTDKPEGKAFFAVVHSVLTEDEIQREFIGRSNILEPDSTPENPKYLMLPCIDPETGEDLRLSKEPLLQGEIGVISSGLTIRLSSNPPKIENCKIVTNLGIGYFQTGDKIEPRELFGDALPLQGQ